MAEGRKRILVVDISREVRAKIREELESGRFEVIEAKNDVEAMVQVTSNAPPDLVTMDVEIPGADGFETFRKLREMHHEKRSPEEKSHPLPVVFITGNDTMEDRKRGFEMGGAEFITKPFQTGEMLAAVNKILCADDGSRDICALVADDSHVSRTVVSACLKREGFRVIEAEDGMKAYEYLRGHGDDVDIVISDMMMPVMDGKSLCRKIRSELSLPDMPIIFLTAVSDLSELLDVFKVGASDYLVKPFAKEELLARIMVHIDRNRMNRKLRETIQYLEEANEEIKRLSIMDSLTGCYNRGYLNVEVPKEILRADRYGRPLSILLCDIDHFKRVNDTYGHQAGDHALVEIVDRLKKITRRDIDWIARYGGEEFIVVLPETPPDGALIVGEKLRRIVASTPVRYLDHEISITASFGVAGFDIVTRRLVGMDDLLRIADRGLYQAKQNGRNQVVRSA